jgi:hypothetical protein
VKSIGTRPGALAIFDKDSDTGCCSWCSVQIGNIEARCFTRPL